MRRVAVTGIGLVTGLGASTEETWQGLVEGRSAVAGIDGDGFPMLQARLGARVGDVDVLNYLETRHRRMARMMTFSDRFAYVAATLAIRDSGLSLSEQDGGRIGLFVGGNKEASEQNYWYEALLGSLREDGTIDMARLGELSPGVYPLVYVEDFASTVMYYISVPYGLQGVNNYLAGLEEAGALAVGSGFRAIRRGDADVAVVGSVSEALNAFQIMRWQLSGTLSTRNELAAAACRPYDKNRTGTVLGEGAAFLVLEEYESAKRRGARTYAEITGYGRTFDGYKLVTPDPCARALSRAIESALREAGTSPEAVEYVVTHGAGTRAGDITDTRGIRGALGPAADRVMASSTKPATGHLLMGAGALQAAVGALALYHQTVPPTLNLESPDPSCDLDWVPGEARDARLRHAVALARGFEGQNVALALSALN
jgi:3-oxoacyl-[acyl-carrier-protein] synthase II